MTIRTVSIDMPITSTSVEFIGPFQQHNVVVDGWEVPLLRAEPGQGGRVTLILDRRFGLDLTLEEAERIVPFIADAISVALGFACHPRRDWAKPRSLPQVRPRRSVSLDPTPEGLD
jgi:hypothetical protein